jgi:hypothetical protein
VIILDENIPDSQRQILRGWRIRVHQIGHEVGRQGIKDEQIVPLLHKLPASTFCTRDLGFYKRQLCHARYCLVCLAVGQYETASFIRRFLRHPVFRKETKRLGKVIRVTHTGIRIWKLRADEEEEQVWLN